MRHRRAMLGLAGVLALLMSGCYESVTPPEYEPGVYKGGHDPLRSKLEQEELQEELSERFQNAARDR